MTFDAHQVQRLFEMWSHHGLGTLALGGINTHGQSYGPEFWFKTKMRSTLTGIQRTERSSHRPRCARWGGPF